MLSTMKKNRESPHVYAENGQSFVQAIGQMDGQRLERLKKDLYQQANENQHQLSVYRF